MTVAPAAPVVADVTTVAPPVGGWAIQTADFGLFFTKILAALLTMITLGFGYPWAKTMVFSKWASNVRIDGRAIRYTGYRTRTVRSLGQGISIVNSNTRNLLSLLGQESVPKVCRCTLGMGLISVRAMNRQP